MRPEHFVQVRGQWKLASLVYDQDLHGGLKSTLVWDPLRQVPEAFDNAHLEEVDMCNSLVWDIGSILLNLIQGAHQLTSREKIRRLCADGLRLQNMKLSQDIIKLLREMLEFDAERRMKLIDLYKHPLLRSKNFDPFVLEGSLIRSNLRSTMKPRIDVLQMSSDSLIKKSNAQQMNFKKNFIDK